MIAVKTGENDAIGETNETFDLLIPSIANRYAAKSSMPEANINL
jgi:hypothetical protein